MEVFEDICVGTIRCQRCETYYLGRIGYEQAEGAPAQYWKRPPAKRKKPSACLHYGPVERWDGSTWELVILVSPALS